MDELRGVIHFAISTRIKIAKCRKLLPCQVIPGGQQKHKGRARTGWRVRRGGRCPGPSGLPLAQRSGFIVAQAETDGTETLMCDLRESRGFHRGVAIAAINAEPAGMMRVAEPDRLLQRDRLTGHISRAHHRISCGTRHERRQQNHDEHNAGICVGH